MINFDHDKSDPKNQIWLDDLIEEDKFSVEFYLRKVIDTVVEHNPIKSVLNWTDFYIDGYKNRKGFNDKCILYEREFLDTFTDLFNGTHKKYDLVFITSEELFFNSSVEDIFENEDYDKILNEIEKKGDVQSKTRLRLAKKVFSVVSRYDSLIANYLNKYTQGDDCLLDENISIGAKELSKLRYGENPHQKAKLYQVTNPQLTKFDYKQLTGKALSFNNLVDTESAFSCVEQFDIPSCVIVKHANPCGVASSKSIENAYKHAYKTDPTSAFGGIIAFNKKINHKLISKILDKQFVEVIAAPGFDKETLEIMKKKPNVRLLKIRLKNKKDIVYEVKLLRDKLLIQEKDSKQITKNDLVTMTLKKPSPRQVEDMIFAFKISRYVKSNSIVIAKNNRTLAIGAGQMSRIDSTNIAYNKAKKQNISLKGSVMASEAFFPFRDNLDLAKKIGVSVIIQPGGSINDEKIIKVANQHKLSMCFSHTRVFKH